MRYFVRVDMDGNPAGTVCRLSIDPVAKTIREESWYSDEKAWKPNNSIIRRLMNGEVLFDEITEERAREIKPDAFDEPMIPPAPSRGRVLP